MENASLTPCWTRRFDGALGVVLSIAAVKVALAEAAPERLRCPLHVIAFAEEEGVRYTSTFLGSRVVAGTPLGADVLAGSDADGVTLAAVLRARANATTDVQLLDVLAAAALPRGSVRGYVEVHIEQGPVLEAMGVPLGVVSAIAGQSRLRVSIVGEAGHAGTVPMGARRDALACAAELVLAVEARCAPPAVGDDAQAEGLVCTVGSLHVQPGASNVIAGAATLTLDVRARRDAVRAATISALRGDIERVCTRRGLACEVELRHEAASLECSPQLRARLEAAAAPVNARHGATVPSLVSGAGHDALAVAALCPVGLLFVRCRGGISHNPAEHATPSDIADAADALLSFIRADQAQAVADRAEL